MINAVRGNQYITLQNGLGHYMSESPAAHCPAAIVASNRTTDLRTQWVIITVYDPSIADTTYTFKNAHSGCFLHMDASAPVLLQASVLDGKNASGPEYLWLMRAAGATTPSTPPPADTGTKNEGSVKRTPTTQGNDTWFRSYTMADLLQWLPSPMDDIGVSFLQAVSDTGVAYRQALTEEDIELLIVASRCFLMTFILPAFMYYGGMSEIHPKFPSSISYTIRKGPARWAHHMTWAPGWAAWGTVFARGNDTVRLFGAWMFVMGLGAVCVFPLDMHGRIADLGHFFCAIHYIFGHAVLLQWFAIPTLYCQAFTIFSIIMVIGFVLVVVLEIAMGIPHGEHERNRGKKKLAIENLDPESSFLLKTLLLVSELMAYGGENGLFIAFVIGMPLGLRSS